MTDSLTVSDDHVAPAGLDSDTLVMMLDALAEFVGHALPAKLQLELDHEDVCPEDIVRAMSDPNQLGVQLVFVPEAFGGMDGGAFDSYRVCEVMARQDIGLATAVFATFLGSDPILFGGTVEQKQRWLGAIAEQGLVFAYGATEPDAGSDLGENGAMNTEGAIAKLMATEAGNAAADAAIQAHGGYGYTREYVVEKIKRDVRITTIYEGTSEIMEMTIARDRWQQHLKTRGAYYRDRAAELTRLQATHPTVGAGHAALAMQALAAVLEACRVARLTRNQHVLFRLGELITHAECAEAMAQRAAAALDGNRHEKTPDRFDGAALAAISRVFAREAAQKVGQEGVRWVAGSIGAGSADVTALLATIPHDAIRASQAGLLDDMDHVADVLYGRIS